MDTTRYAMDTLPQWIGKELGVSPWTTIDQPRIDEFAHCTGDNQWIHTDVERARRESPFGGPVAHGYLTLSLLAGAAGDIGIAPADAVACFNYGLDKVRFIAPVKSGARVRCRITLADVADQGKGRRLIRMNNTVEIEGQEKPALIAETLAVLVGAA
ncbi:MaoC family dehydratase [Variovorax sp. GT1P44]|uniref:MaoC family dehydratase n=1 Tax=Variovorax sp. GT1P44 TaxID=3443742 RepID=UPI003F4794D7